MDVALFIEAKNSRPTSIFQSNKCSNDFASISNIPHQLAGTSLNDQLIVAW